MEDRDEKILRHIGLYYITLRTTLERVFFDGKKTACGNVITRLTKQERVVSRERAFPGGLSYYQLAEAQAKELGIPEYRAKAPAGQSLPEKLSVLWFCCMGETKRRRIEKEKLKEIFSGETFPGPHCFERDSKEQRLYRIFSPSADDEYLFRQVRDHLDLVQERGAYDWLKTRTYGVALLCETETRREKLEREFREKGLSDRTHHIIEVVPSPNTLKEAINALSPVSDSSGQRE